MRLREVRNSKGWSLEETEEHGWHNWRVLQAIESGRNLKFENLIKIADLYGMSLSDLLKGV